MGAHDGRVLEKTFGSNGFEDASAAHHVDEVATPGGVEAGAHPEHVVRDLVDAPTCHHPAHLGLLPERDEVGPYPQLLVGPGGSGEPAAGLDLVEDQQRV